MRARLAGMVVGMLVSLGVVSARAELTADQVGVIAMATSGESQRLADYYAHARGIPAERIFLLEGKPHEVLARRDWEDRVRPALRRWLAVRELEGKIRCLVTVGDVPLKIGPREPKSPEVVERRALLEQARVRCAQQCTELLGTIRTSIGGRTALPAAEAKYAQWMAAFEALLKEVDAWRHSVSDAQRKEFDAQFEKTFLTARGLGSLVRIVQRADSAKLPPEKARQLEQSRGRLAGLEQGFAALMGMPESAARDAQTLPLAEHIGGLLGALQWLEAQLADLDKNETYASFDSELSLLLWPDYPLSRWQANWLYYRFDALPHPHPTLMVARLAAPSSELVKRLIDAGLAVEKSGLEGTVYLDARGIHDDPKHLQSGSPGEYDQSLRNLAERLKAHTPLKVVLNDEAKLFQPGDCPEAALYCGWYSLGQYVDAFTWQPGSVGYHIASMEAETLRDPKSNVWCNAMLRHGIAATLGPTYEPYLPSFPLPDEFFSLLLTGRYTLAEVYARTAPFSSWVMVLVGDPLYNPFKNRPLLQEADLPETLRAQAAPPQPPSLLPAEEKEK